MAALSCKCFKCLPLKYPWLRHSCLQSSLCRLCCQHYKKSTSQPEARNIHIYIYTYIHCVCLSCQFLYKPNFREFMRMMCVVCLDLKQCILHVYLFIMLWWKTVRHHKITAKCPIKHFPEPQDLFHVHLRKSEMNFAYNRTFKKSCSW